MTVTFDGMDCIADLSSDAFMAAYTASQADIPWLTQFVYAKYTVYFGVVILFLATIKNVWFKYADIKYKNKSSKESLEPGYLGSFIAVLTSFSRCIGYKPINVSISKYLGLPATSGSFLFVVATTAYLACYSFIPHYWYRGCAGFGSPPIAVRTGVMATALIPFVYVLSGKTNTITLLTGISYEKLNGIHQFIGVACFVLSVVHTIPFIYQDFAEGGGSVVATNFKTFSYYSGIPPLIFLGILCFGGNSIVRKYFYEAFLHLHWICGIAFFGTAVWHIDNTNGMWDYMWGALAFWMAQLMYRALVKTCFRPNALFMRARPAQLRRLDSRTFEVSVTNVADMKWSPGQHCYLRFAGSRILDNHPFSINSISNEDLKESNEMKFIIIPKNGLTQVLHNELEESITCKKKVFLDGPYGGCPRDPLSFDNLTMISTGSGVTVTLPFLEHAAHNIAKANSNSLPIALRDIHFIWIVRYQENIEWIKEALDRAYELAGEYITIDIYVAKSESANGLNHLEETHYESKSPSSQEKVMESTFESSRLISKGFNVYFEKPNLSDILKDSKRFLKRKNMIVSSGSASMRREVCSGISSLQSMIFNADLAKSSTPVEEIYLHTEAFGWF